MPVIRTISIAISLFALLGVAVAAAVSRPHDKRAVLCDADAGSNLIHDDCIAASRKFPKITFADDESFSRHAPDGVLRLPQMFTEGTCIIYVDTTGELETVRTTWGQILIRTHTLVNRCVSGTPQHMGGCDYHPGTQICLFNEASMRPSVLANWNKCKSFMKDNRQGLLDKCTTALRTELTQGLPANASELFAKHGLMIDVSRPPNPGPSNPGPSNPGPSNPGPSTSGSGTDGRPAQNGSAQTAEEWNRQWEDTS